MSLELRLLARKVSGEVGIESGGVEEEKAVSGFRGGFCGVGHLLAVVRCGFACIERVSRNVDKGGDRGIVPRHGDDGASVTVPDQYARTVLTSEDTLGRGHIVRKRSQRLLNDAHVISVSDQNIVHRLPARSIDKGAMNQHDVLYRPILGRGETHSAPCCTRGDDAEYKRRLPIIHGLALLNKIDERRPN